MIFGKDYDFSLIKTSSKEALLRSALTACNNDIKKAAEICDYVTKMLPDLPATDPIMPSTLDQVKETAVGIFQWGRDNQEQIIGGINFILKMIGRNPIGAVAETAEVLTETPKPIA